MQIPSARSLITRKKMFEATEAILSRSGYAAWSEELLCEMCQCSRGALRHQFPEGRYDLFPAYLESVISNDARMVASMGELSPVERMYLFLGSLQFRQPSEATHAMMEISMASRGDAKMFARLKPILDSANARVLGLTEAVTDPEILALRNLLHGVALYSFDLDYSADALTSSVKWIFQYLPVPESIKARIDEMIKVRKQASSSQH